MNTFPFSSPQNGTQNGTIQPVKYEFLPGSDKKIVKFQAFYKGHLQRKLYKEKLNSVTFNL